MAGRDGFKRNLEIGERFDVVDFGGLDQGCDAAPCLATLVGSSVIMPGVWGLTRSSLIRFTRCLGRRLMLLVQLSMIFAFIL
jgi:hypothetical protein